jgi:hypothetical protein
MVSINFGRIVGIPEIEKALEHALGVSEKPVLDSIRSY